MIRKYLLPIFSIAGFLFAIWMVLQGAKAIPPSKPLTEPPHPPYAHKISGAGILEPSTQNIAIGTQVSGLVDRIHVSVGQHVQVGELLFSLDSRKHRAALVVREAALAEAKAKLTRLLAAPRKEDLPPSLAKVKEAEANLEDLRLLLQTAIKVHQEQVISREDLDRRRFAAQAAEARLSQAKANLNLLEAGAWQPDIQVAKAEAAKVEAEVLAEKVELDLLHIRAPVDGDILQVNIRPGEYAQSGVPSKPLIMMGNLERLHVRVDIDENDAWRFQPEAPALAFVRGNPELKTQLRFEYMEPYVIPKRSLTGESTERVDTRVMQVVYSFKRGGINVYPGQLMDVYIEDNTARSVRSPISQEPGRSP